MLQIATGKLFTAAVGRENRLRGILYTNAVFAREESAQTAAGCLLPSSSYSIRPHVLIYEFIERMEDEGVKPGVLISSTVDPYLHDFSVVASFALNCTCTPDVDLARRLTSGGRGLVTGVAPQELVRRFFDKEYWCQPDDIAFLRDFTNKLIGLPRSTFLGVMRALRTYVNGMHRIADDLELAYTLLVASVESLAQDFDGHESDWESFDERKRKAVDEALSAADEVTAQRVREALLRVEHIALGRRFREFAVAHTRPSYFREASGSDGFRLGRSDLAEVLGLAYQSRSKYVHQLRRVPDMVTMGHSHAETAVDGRSTHLTLQGLARLMRSIIIEFVMRQISIDREPYDYRLERSGVVQMQLAPQYWVGRAEGEITKAGRVKLEGFLQQLESCLLKQPDAVLTDIRPVLEKAVEFVPSTKKLHRLPYLALHFLFNCHVSEDNSAPTPSAINALIEKELGEPSSESLIAHALSGQLVDWPLEVHRQTLDGYLRRRAAASGLRFPRAFEAAITLDLAERYRLVGDIEACKAMVALAVENHPGHAGLLEFEETFQAESPIGWRDVMLPTSKEPTVEAAASS
ncbi:hypothetical protein [Cupriavidus sp. IDO]|uniref:hypothetical protein n=1 Tax=Cupriavidus sp. IDO TaxID=1539142 RepID=UPI0005794082|nr:hypothetical protein [Cupriavidus sp. IDO]KWR75141.1 hypothetical protein RM96_34565 [Cupriavidus sp. IDO]